MKEITQPCFSLRSLIALAILSTLTSCVESTLQGTGESRAPAPKPAPILLTEKDVRLRFLTAFIKGDRQTAMRYATPTAIAQLPWRPASSGYLPHYCDRGILWFHGGHAKLTFGESEGQLKITNFAVLKKF